MASFDKQSVRAEFDKIKVSFDAQVKAGKVSSDVAVLINTLFVLFSVVLSIFLEKQTKKTSANSSIPPSQTEKDETTPSKNKTPKNSRDETITTLGNTRTVETVTTLPVTTCLKCGDDLTRVECTCIERRTKIDIIFEKTVEHIDVESKQCPSCHATTKSTFPEDMHGPLQYGNGIKAYVVQLMVTQMLSLERTAKMVACVIGQLISEATLLSYIMRLYTALEAWDADARLKILKSNCMHSDETSCRVDKKNHWVHVYSAGDITLKYLHPKRGKEAIESIDILPHYQGVVVHDCWASYLSYDHCAHALCGSHLLRELTFVVDANGYRWAKNLKRLLKVACKSVTNNPKKCFDEKTYDKLQACYRRILLSGKQELPPIAEKTTGRRGKIAKSDAHNLWERFDKYEAAVLLFAKLAHVPFTNNRAERDLRMGKVKQKVSGCFRVEKYAHAYCRISSYLQTMQNKGINPLVAVSMAFAGEFDL
jgi:transposase